MLDCEKFRIHGLCIGLQLSEVFPAYTNSLSVLSAVCLQEGGVPYRYTALNQAQQETAVLPICLFFSTTGLNGQHTRPFCVHMLNLVG